MTFPEKNNFVVKHTSAEYFEADKKLYKRLYPDSRLTPELEKANQYNKEHLDGRMLLKILDVVCGETVLENRGIITDWMKEQVTPAPSPEPVPDMPPTGQEAAADQAEGEDAGNFTFDIPAKPKTPRKKKAVPKKNTPQ
jgi:hypothetical protein